VPTDQGKQPLSMVQSDFGVDDDLVGFQQVGSFLAIDYETANSSYESVCAVGVTLVEENIVKSNFYTLIKPPKEFLFFDPFNTSIHNIEKSDVKNSPSFGDIWGEIEKLYAPKGLPIACHYAGFDIRVTEALLDYLGNEFTPIRFYDTCTVSKKVWPELINFKLNTISQHLKIELDHHNAASDAQACARIAIKHMELTSSNSLSDVAKNFGFNLGVLDSNGVKRMSDFKKYHSKNPTDYGKYLQSSKDLLPTSEVNSNSEMFGMKIVFTGELKSMNRTEAIQRAVNNGAVVASTVSKKTNYLIVGTSDFLDFENGIKTNKLKNAEKVKESGGIIEIIDEEDFLRMTIS
jgi:DNA polymerase-3 subunit epsilon